ncbi:MAG: NAD(P)-dependent oxidoreductase [Gammaproteobacteria bacterium]|nr:NAD(P)-dependent oxidoreductase [Gammaproteobacteria bacterium]
MTDQCLKKIAVTGASGFVGRHVLSELMRRPVAIVAVTRVASRLVNLGTAVQIVEMDIAQANADSYDQLGRPDILIHLAWNGLPNYNSLHHFEIELPQQYHFLKSMLEAGLPALLVTGTCFEYGMQSGALSEDLAPLPINPYGYAKDALRRQLEFFSIAHPFTLTWARLFYTYGDGQSKNSLLPQLQKAIDRGDTIFDMSGGEQLRDYLPVEEISRLIVELALSDSNIGIVNICAGNPISVRRLVESLIQKNHWEISINLGHYPYPDYEPMAFWGDRRRLDRILEQA